MSMTRNDWTEFVARRTKDGPIANIEPVTLKAGAVPRKDTVGDNPFIAGLSPAPKRKVSLVAPERDVLAAVRTALSHHPAVDRIFRVNSGAHVAGEGKSRRFVRYHDIPGMSDLWVWLKPSHGTRQAFIEVKRPGEKPTEKQAALLEVARERGHIAFVTDDVSDAWRQFNEALEA